jgi:hypothetical protein
MTESGMRHITQKVANNPSVVTTQGLELMKSFLTWFGAQQHPHKVFIGGNHDWVLQGTWQVLSCSYFSPGP